LITQARVRLAGDALGESRHKAGLADPRLARDQHDLPFALPSEALALQQEIELVLAADEIGITSAITRGRLSRSSAPKEANPERGSNVWTKKRAT
jgi:hypothetical protein